MKNFLKYAQYYNVLYKEKDYKKEVDYVSHLIKCYAGNNKKTLLDIGCGTGRHAIEFTNKGYETAGIDKSAEMIKIARTTAEAKEKKIKFYLCDSARFNLNRKFDIVVSLFHVMSYQTTNELVLNTIKNAYRHLNNNGMFIFDFWYGPAVIIQKPSVRIKEFNDKEVLIKRTAVPKMNFNDNTVDICYKIEIRNKKNNSIKVFTEHHIMRYFFLPELYLMLETAGFRVVKCLKWMSLKESVSQNSWNGVIIAKKITFSNNHQRFSVV
ncbi:MAG: class I SAM-dependent methyltransferase [Candidatus Omnitrophota bacterium]